MLVDNDNSDVIWTTSTLNRLAAVIAKIPLVKNDEGLFSPTKTISAYKNSGQMIEIKGVRYTTKFVISALKGLHTRPWTTALSKKDKEDFFNQATPIFFLAYKMYENVSYDMWATNEDHIDMFLGYSWKGFDNLPDWYSIDFKKDIQELRIKAATDSSGILHSYTKYKCNKTGVAAIDSLPMFFRCMYLQLWIFNAQRRNEDRMILNWTNWSAIPEEFDNVIVQKETADDLFSW